MNPWNVENASIVRATREVVGRGDDAARFVSVCRASFGRQRFSRLKMKRGKWRTTSMISAHWAGA
jgi:hypothetical protein